MTVKSNIWNLEVGDKISFTNNRNAYIESIVTRVEEKSWYSPNRQSYGTLAYYEKRYKDFKITKNPLK